MESKINVKLWGSKLSGKESAIMFRNTCLQKLKEDQVLVLNMAGVKEVAPGFAYECFGMLYLSAVRRGSRIKFENTKKELEGILLAGVQSAIR